MGFFFQKHLMFCGPQNARFQELEEETQDVNHQ
jgi:hypothetical protein